LIKPLENFDSTVLKMNNDISVKNGSKCRQTAIISKVTKVIFFKYKKQIIIQIDIKKYGLKQSLEVHLNLTQLTERASYTNSIFSFAKKISDYFYQSHTPLI